MAKWMARSRGLLVKRLEVTQVPEEGQSTHQPVWSKVNLASVLDMVEHLNDKTETSRALLAEINKLKADNERLREMAYGRPPGEFARGGYVPRQPIRAVPAQRSEARKALDSLKERFDPSAQPFSVQHINREPGVMVTINAQDASNGELADKVRVMNVVKVELSGCTTKEQAARIAEHLSPYLGPRDPMPGRTSDTGGDISAIGWGMVAAGGEMLREAGRTPAESSSCDTPTNTDSSSPTPSE